MIRKITGLVLIGTPLLLMAWAVVAVAPLILNNPLDWSRIARELSRFPWPLPAAWPVAAAAVLAGTLLAVLVRKKLRGTRRPGEEHGSARWGRRRDIAPLMRRHGNLMLTRTEGIALKRVRKAKHQRNLNVVVFGSSGSGKSRLFIQPNLVQAQTSMLVTDPKGELLGACGEQIAEAGHAIRVLNLVDLDQSDGFNPFVYLRPGREPEDVELMARNLIANTEDPTAKASDPFWPRAERALMAALIALVASTYGERDQHLGSVVDLLSAMRSTGETDTIISETDSVFAAAERYLRDHPEMDRRDVLQYALSMHQIYKQAADKTQASIIVTFATRLAPLYIPAVRRLIEHDTLELDRVGREATALFLVISDTNRQWGWLASLVFTIFFQRSIWLADREPERRLPKPVVCWMDEFANIGTIPDFDVLAATMRSRGISYVLALQNISQGKARYREGWEAILGNCDSVLFLGSGDRATTEYVSKGLGNQTIEVVETSVSRGRSGSSSKSKRRQRRELMTADEVARLPGEEALLMIRGLPPFRSRKLKPVATGNYRYERDRNERGELQRGASGALGRGGRGVERSDQQAGDKGAA